MRPMRRILIGLLLVASACFGADDPKFPLPSGRHTFQWRDAEFPQGPGFQVTVAVSGLRIEVLNDRGTRRGVPAGTLAQGTAMWHATLRKWIIGEKPTDRLAPGAGGCNGEEDPLVIDIEKREIWSCMWGP